MSESVTIEQLTEEWPGWHIRQSGAAGWWKATRSAEGARLACTLIEDTGPELKAALDRQADMDERGGYRLPEETEAARERTRAGSRDIGSSWS